MIVAKLEGVVRPFLIQVNNEARVETAAPAGRQPLTLWGSGASGGREFVHARPVLDLLRGDLEPELLLQRAGHGTTNRM